MDDSSRAAALASLQTTRDAFHAAVARLSESQARFQPTPDHWSVADIVEHVAVAEHGMFRFISELHEVSADPHTSDSAASLARTADRKTLPLAAPVRVHPKNRFGSFDAALSKFLENRARTIEFVKTCPGDLSNRIIRHPVGILNGQDCLQVLISHPVRHLAQINELKSHPAFPAS